MNKLQRQGGFTLIEVIVVAGIIAVLAGILVPLIFKEIDEARITRASADIKSISTAILVFKKDTSQWPMYDGSCATTITFLKGAGATPASWPTTNWDATNEDGFDSYLSADNYSCSGARWKGPYMAIVNADPWGNAYLMNTKALSATTGPVWIVSAGPNGNLDTDANSTTLGGDDVGVRIR